MNVIWLLLIPLVLLNLFHANDVLAAAPSKPLKLGYNLLQGAQIYRNNCLACHGNNGDGRKGVTARSKVKVPVFSTDNAALSKSSQQLIERVASGHKVNTAKYWRRKLTAQQLSNVAAYINEAFMTPFAAIDAKEGRRIYARTCSVCHGERGNAASWARNSLNPSPLDFTSFKAKKLTRRHMVNTVTYGKDGTAMMGFTIKLTRSQIASVVDHVRSTFMFPKPVAVSKKSENSTPKILKNGNPGHTQQQAIARDMSALFPNHLQGIRAEGEKFFNGNCAACHGKRGLGDGPRAYFIYPRPANFNDKRARAELNRPHLFKSISNGLVGTVMPSWSKVLTNQEIANVAEYVFTEFIQPQAPQTSEAAQPNSTKNKGDKNWQRHLGNNAPAKHNQTEEHNDPNAGLRLKKKP